MKPSHNNKNWPPATSQLNQGARKKCSPLSPLRTPLFPLQKKEVCNSSLGGQGGHLFTQHYSCPPGLDAHFSLNTRLWGDIFLVRQMVSLNRPGQALCSIGLGATSVLRRLGFAPHEGHSAKIGNKVASETYQNDTCHETQIFIFRLCPKLQKHPCFCNSLRNVVPVAPPVLPTRRSVTLFSFQSESRQFGPTHYPHQSRTCHKLWPSEAEPLEIDQDRSFNPPSRILLLALKLIFPKASVQTASKSLSGFARL